MTELYLLNDLIPPLESLLKSREKMSNGAPGDLPQQVWLNCPRISAKWRNNSS